MMKKLGFIGAGNMASAMMGGIIRSEIFAPDEIIVSDVSESALQRVSSTYGVNITASNIDVVKNSEVFILAVKPQYYASVIAEISSYVTDSQLIITIAPGQTLAGLKEKFGSGSDSVKIIRTMPNTPAMVGEGITAVTPNGNVSPQELEYACKILSGFGLAEVISENLMDAVVSVSGSSPAYVFMFIEAMADAAVADGMPRAQAYKFAAQAVMGSAKMVLETGKHPGELKDMVCSPAGTTIEAVRVLEEKGMRSAVIEAMKACTRKAKGM
ncbi:MAG: pyrroline-5-carboxylate reductase [Acutalibacteraceae bacterium]